MSSIPQIQPAASAEPKRFAVAIERPADDDYKTIRKLIWVYFWLLIFEGALRKWVLPSLASPLLVIRDPFLVLLYMVAMQRGKFPQNTFVSGAIFLSIGTILTSVFVSQVDNFKTNAVVILFGLHTNFLHIPLIFLIRDAFGREELRLLGKRLMILAPLMAVLVFLQYRSGPDSWLNRGAGADAKQIWSGVASSEKIRPAGLFSYNTGLGFYLSLLAAFIFNQLLRPKEKSSEGLFVLAAVSLVVATVLAISRSTALGVTLVWTASVISIILIPRLATRSVFVIGVVALAAFAVSKISVLGEGINLLQSRIEEAQGFKTGGWDRFMSGFTEPFQIMENAGLLGWGLGLGTNAGGWMATGEHVFALNAENEWSRVLMESGVLLGIPFLILRVALASSIIKVGFIGVKNSDPLPLMLGATCFLNVLTGQWGVPMNLGFAIFGAGLAFAAARVSGEVSNAESETSTDTPQAPLLPTERVIRGRSEYAERMHAGQAPKARDS